MKFYGSIGFGESVEKPAGSGVWVDDISEYPYYGDVVRNSRLLQATGEKVNDDVTVSNSISVVGDQFIHEHFFNIRYVMWQGKRWRVSNVEVAAPRLILQLGEVYNGPTPE